MANCIVSTRRSNSNIQKRFFHNYLDLCRTKNVLPVREIKSNSRNMVALEFKADHVNCYEWINIIKCLSEDESLQVISIHLRKSAPDCAEAVDTFQKATLVRNYPTVLTKYIFEMLIDTIAGLVERSSQIRVLSLKGLPIKAKYCTQLTKSLSANQSIQSLNFAWCPLGDEGCAELCSVLNHVVNIERLNLSGCLISDKGAKNVAEFIKMHRISRFNDAWKLSLRYRDVTSVQQPGIKFININNNLELGDQGCEAIAHELIEDEWVHTVEMQNCGLTMAGANAVIACLKKNKRLQMFNVQRNSEIPLHMLARIDEQLGINPKDLNSGFQVPMTKSVALTERIAQLEMQLSTEKFRCNELSKLSDKLNAQIFEFHKQQTLPAEPVVPEGYTLIKDEALQGLLNECQSLRCYAAMTQQQELSQPSPVSTKTQKPKKKNFYRRPILRSVGKTRSESPAKGTRRTKPCTQSDSALRLAICRGRPNIEANVGDNLDNNRKMYGEDSLESTAREASQIFTAAEALRVLIKNKTEKPDFQPKLCTMEHLEAGDYASTRTMTTRTYRSVLEYFSDDEESFEDRENYD